MLWPDKAADRASFGASFSLHYCTQLGLDAHKRMILRAACEELGLRRFRLMSYWNIHEPRRGQYDFRQLDWQLDMVAAHGGRVSLCLGKRQPRWPECHMPAWALVLPRQQWYRALYDYIEVVVCRYRSHPALESYQLENEALLRRFGHCRDGDYSRRRLRHERDLVRRLDPAHPIVMSMSDSWGLPWRGPWPDMFGYSVYVRLRDRHGRLQATKYPAWWFGLRAILVRLYSGRRSFIHELQAEPWTTRDIQATAAGEQDAVMSVAQLRRNVAYAQATGLGPYYLWGLEWWYWRRMQGNSRPWDYIATLR